MTRCCVSGCGSSKYKNKGEISLHSGFNQMTATDTYNPEQAKLRMHLAGMRRPACFPAPFPAIASRVSTTMAEPDPHQMMSCPYNPAHQVEHYRMHIHLQKCRKQYPNAQKTICPFDATHVVNAQELEYHVNRCSKRHLFDTQKYVIDDTSKPVVEAPLPAPATTATEECWDDDNVESYKPDPSKKGSHIITKIKGATPSERRAHRMKLIQNYQPPPQPHADN